MGLPRFKRDLKNLGMTEAQVHEIIPEAASGTGTNNATSPTSPPATQTPQKI